MHDRRIAVFATEFRYLRNGDLCLENVRWDQCFRKNFVNRKSTYHVGENFLDIADGLQAIDEAVMFLSLAKGDHLGHALVLGMIQLRIMWANITAFVCQSRITWIIWYGYYIVRWNLVL